MERFASKIALVSGAGSGIGKATAVELVNNGMKVAGIDIMMDRLQELESDLKGMSGVFKGIKCDVTNSEEVKKIFHWIEENWGGISVLVNCAGLMNVLPLSDCDIEKFRHLLDVNILGYTALCSGSIKSMIDHSIEGHIINICSICGHIMMGRNGMAPYTISKHSVKLFSEFLRKELLSISSPKIRVTNISPGMVETEMTEKFRKDTNKPGEPLKDAPTLYPKDIGDCIKFVLASPPHVNITELMVQPTGENF